MDFPVHIPLFGWRLHPHLLFELLAYFVGFQVYRAARRRAPDHIGSDHRWTVLAAAALGAWLGSKVLSWLNDPVQTFEHAGAASTWLGGKTIVGGLLGGWGAVEWVKTRAGIAARTGDVYVVPLLVATMIGRVGCFLTGLDDHTHGVATALPWGVDFGDGVRRHPTQLYEMACLALFVWPCWRIYLARARAGCADGRLFRAYLAGYLAFRFAVDWLKPDGAVFGMSGIQWACLAGAGLVLSSAAAPARRAA